MVPLVLKDLFFSNFLIVYLREWNFCGMPESSGVAHWSTWDDVLTFLNAIWKDIIESINFKHHVFTLMINLLIIV